MSSEAITRNDLEAILGSILPTPAGAQVGSSIAVRGSDTTVTLSTSYKTIPMVETLRNYGNVFSLDTTSGGVVCAYTGIVLISACVWLYSSYTANDIISAIVNSDGTGYIETPGRFRVPANVTAPNTKLIIPVGAYLVQEGETLTVLCENVTGARGTVRPDGSFLSLTYLSPVL